MVYINLYSKNENLCLAIETLPNDKINVLGGIYKMLGDHSLIINMFLGKEV